MTSVLQIAVLLLTNNFLAYLLTNSACMALSRVAACLYLNRKFPILTRKPPVPLSKEKTRRIFKDVKSLVMCQLASVAVHSTDNILISTLSGLGVVAVGYINNYNMLMNSVLGFVRILFESVTSGFGNMVASSSTENFRKVFKEINFANFWIYGFCSVAFWILIPPFITLWIGADKLIDGVSFTLIVLNCYLQGQSFAFNSARIAKGNFGKDKSWALLQALVNLVVSIIGAKCLGLVGICIGTVVSRLVYVFFRFFLPIIFCLRNRRRNFILSLCCIF